MTRVGILFQDGFCNEEDTCTDPENRQDDDWTAEASCFPTQHHSTEPAFWWEGLVVRGGTGFTTPYAGEIQKSGTRSTYDANLAVGYYLTPHDYAPFLGDLVGYVATNLTQVIDNRGPNSPTVVTLGPGFRSHVIDNWYLLGAVEVPVTNPQPFDYQVLGGIMKVY